MNAPALRVPLILALAAGLLGPVKGVSAQSGGTCGTVDASQLQPQSGFAYLLPQFADGGDSSGAAAVSRVVVYENNVVLGPAHSPHELIRTTGKGAYSHWRTSLYLSTSDNSDPRNNGRRYSYGVMAGACPVSLAPLPIEMTRIASEAPLYATFQSHNQKVVETRFGIFLTYLDKVKTIPGRCPHFPQPPCYDSPYLWKLVRSTDSGRTFSTVYEATADTRAPTVESDQAGDLYLFSTEYAPGKSDAFLYRFFSADSFRTPAVTPIPGAAGGKVTSFLDAGRRQLYYMNNNGGVTDFYVFGLDGKLLRSAQLLKNGPHAVLQYPFLAMSGSTLYAAWTTSLVVKYLYWDIHFMMSDDGGLTWRKGNGASLTLPVVVDETGPADSLVLKDEYGYHNFLAGLAAQGEYLHFMYESQVPGYREHYLRYNTRTHALDINTYPTWKGDQLSIRNLDGFFASDTAPSGGLLYAISSDNAPKGDKRIVVLASPDSGRTWFDYAVSPPVSHPYAIGGARIARAGGSIIGSFTNLLQPDSGATANVDEVWFIRVGAR